MSTKEGGNSEASALPVTLQSQETITRTPSKTCVRPRPAGERGPSAPGKVALASSAFTAGTTASITFAIRTGSPGRTMSTVASASAGSAALTASSGSERWSVPASRPAHRDPPRILALDAVLLRVRFRLGALLDGNRLTGRDAVRADAEVAELVRRRLRERDDGRLGRVVRGLRRLVLERVRRGDVHDRASAAVDHVPRGDLHRGEHR